MGSTAERLREQIEARGAALSIAVEAADAFVKGTEFSEGMEKVTVRGRVLYTYGPHVIASRGATGRTQRDIVLPGDIPREETARNRLNTVLEKCDSPTRVRVTGEGWMVVTGRETAHYTDTDRVRSCPLAEEVPVKLVKVMQRTLEGKEVPAPLRTEFGTKCRAPTVLWRNAEAIKECANATANWTGGNKACEKEMTQMGFKPLAAGQMRTGYQYGDCVIKIGKNLSESGKVDIGGARANASEFYDINYWIPKGAREAFVPIDEVGPLLNEAGQIVRNPDGSFAKFPMEKVRDPSPGDPEKYAFLWTTAPFIAANEPLSGGERKVREILEKHGVDCVDWGGGHNVGIYQGRQVIMDAGGLYGEGFGRTGKRSVSCRLRRSGKRLFDYAKKTGENA